ncbi:hypothetical protein PF002_g15103 [Phytophthora fragariae]|uniref:Uncharacterized protein n=1 Tax=Phytophthora fragariae TaxID=53985 RepID=A0A6A3TSJ9_9STRA|nr:hypothetical protein PF006_g12866 [Phytophthora fragariae]KAE9222963.1 hypothetical protein PF002_g15103 [Phytophthora fragariae]
MRSASAATVATAEPDTQSPVPRGFEVYVNSLVVYTPAKEKWLTTKKLAPTFGQVGTAYIVGRVGRRFIEKKLVLYEIRWLDSLFQKHIHSVKIGVLQRGIENYRVLSRSTSKPTWSALNTTPDGEDLPSDALLEDFVEVEGYTEFDPDQALPTSLREVETIKSMKFDPRVQMNEPTDLYKHFDGSVNTRVRPECVRLFTHSASSSFLAYRHYIPIQPTGGLWSPRVG